MAIRHRQSYLSMALPARGTNVHSEPRWSISLCNAHHKVYELSHEVFEEARPKHGHEMGASLRRGIFLVAALGP